MRTRALGRQEEDRRAQAAAELPSGHGSAKHGGTINDALLHIFAMSNDSAEMSASPSIMALERDRATRTEGDRSRPERSRSKIYSRPDEDGIIQEIFRRIGIKHKTFVEFDFEVDPKNNSRSLLQQGWRGL